MVFSTKPKHVANIVKKKGICLLINICPLSDKILWFCIIKNGIPNHTQDEGP